MRAAVTTGPHSMDLLEVPDPPEPSAGEVVVRPEAVGICGSDFHFYEGTMQIFESSPFPRVQGHEVGARVEAVGPGSTGGLGVGDRVALWPLTQCDDCYPCALGRGNVCDDFSLIGIHEDGGLQELLLMPSSHVYPIAVERPEIAALAEPVSIAVRSMARARIEEGERFVVLGAGPIGQAIQLLGQERGGIPLIVDRIESRLELGRELGADAVAWSDPESLAEQAREWAGGDIPLVFDATGAAGPIRAAVDMAASAGRVVIVGMSGEEVPLRVGSFTEKELDVLGVSCCGAGEFGDAVAFVERQAPRLERLVSHEFPLDRAPEALEFAIDNPTEVMKVVIRTS